MLQFRAKDPQESPPKTWVARQFARGSKMFVLRSFWTWLFVELLLTESVAFRLVVEFESSLVRCWIWTVDQEELPSIVAHRPFDHDAKAL